MNFGRFVSCFGYKNSLVSVRMSSTLGARLQGKVAIITASTDGIGYAIAKRLGQEGAKIVISSRKQENVLKATNSLKNLGITVSGVECHVSNDQHRNNLIEHALKEYGGIDILVSNAGINPVAGGVLDCPEQVWDKIFDTNLKAGLMLTKLVVPHMRKRGGGAIVLVSSITGFHPIPLLGAYSVSKTALLGLTNVLAKELANDNIRVNSLVPGIVRTKLSGALHENPEVEETILTQIPLRRLAVPDEISGTAAFLCSQDASYITGENIVIAGGMASHL